MIPEDAVCAICQSEEMPGPSGASEASAGANSSLVTCRKCKEIVHPECLKNKISTGADGIRDKQRADTWECPKCVVKKKNRIYTKNLKKGYPKKNRLKKSRQKKSTPKKSMPKKSTPDEDASDEDVIDEDTPDEDISEEDTPDKGAPNRDVPDEDAPKDDAPEDQEPCECTCHNVENDCKNFWLQLHEDNNLEKVLAALNERTAKLFSKLLKTEASAEDCTLFWELLGAHNLLPQVFDILAKSILDFVYTLKKRFKAKKISDTIFDDLNIVNNTALLELLNIVSTEQECGENDSGHITTFILDTGAENRKNAVHEGTKSTPTPMQPVIATRPSKTPRKRKLEPREDFQDIEVQECETMKLNVGTGAKGNMPRSSRALNIPLANSKPAVVYDEMRECGLPKNSLTCPQCCLGNFEDMFHLYSHLTLTHKMPEQKALKMGKDVEEQSAAILKGKNRMVAEHAYALVSPPKSKHTLPLIQPTARSSQNTARSTQKTAPSSQNTAPSSQKTTNSSKKTAPSSQKTAPSSQKTAPSSQKTAPSSQNTAPSSQNTTPRSKLAKQNRQAHQSYEKVKKPDLECLICNRIFPNERNLRSHLKELHGFSPRESFTMTNVSHQVATLDLSLKRSSDTATNSRTGQFWCDECGASCKTPSDLARHLLSHNIIVEEIAKIIDMRWKMFACDLCSKRYEAYKLLYVHFKASHKLSEDKARAKVAELFPDTRIELLVYCELCTSCLRTRRDLKKHLLKSHCVSAEIVKKKLARSFPRSRASNTATAEDVLDEGVPVEEEEPSDKPTLDKLNDVQSNGLEVKQETQENLDQASNVTCSSCAKDCGDCANLIFHLIEVHAVLLHEAEDKVEAAYPHVMPYSCDFCPEKMSYLEVLIEHLRSTHKCTWPKMTKKIVALYPEASETLKILNERWRTKPTKFKAGTSLLKEEDVSHLDDEEVAKTADDPPGEEADDPPGEEADDLPGEEADENEEEDVALDKDTGPSQDIEPNKVKDEPRPLEGELSEAEGPPKKRAKTGKKFKKKKKEKKAKRRDSKETAPAWTPASASCPFCFRFFPDKAIMEEHKLTHTSVVNVILVNDDLLAAEKEGDFQIQ